MTSIYWDCFSGIAGNMAVASLLDLGADKNELVKAINSINFEEGPVELIFEERLSHGIRGLYFNTSDDDCSSESNHNNAHKHEHVHEHVHEHTHEHIHENDSTHSHDHGHAPHRGYTEICKLIDNADITDNARKMAKACFKSLGEAEAKIHGKTIEDIHFHEVGARDSIADIVGVAVCLDNLGIDEVYTSDVSVGSGMVKCAHGLIPVPAPATAMLLEGFPIKSNSDEPYELTTPTGAAILKGLNAKIGMPKGFRYSEIGHGLGSLDIGRSNFLRVFISKETKKKILNDTVVKFETNLDNVTGELLGYVSKKLMDKGALDVNIVSAYMKKGRPGHILTVLSKLELEDEIETIIFDELPTLGVRKSFVHRRVLKREDYIVKSAHGDCHGKRIFEADGSERTVTEFDAKIDLSEKVNIPVRKLKD